MLQTWIQWWRQLLPEKVFRIEVINVLRNAEYFLLGRDRIWYLSYRLLTCLWFGRFLRLVGYAVTDILPETLDNLLPDSVSGFFKEIGVKQWVKHTAGFPALFGSGVRIVHCLTGLLDILNRGSRGRG